METKITQVLEQQITEVELRIDQTKIAIANLFVKIHKGPPLPGANVDEFLNKVKEMSKMPELLSILERYETKLETLKTSKTTVVQALKTV